MAMIINHKAIIFQFGYLLNFDNFFLFDNFKDTLLSYIQISLSIY